MLAPKINSRQILELMRYLAVGGLTWLLDLILYFTILALTDSYLAAENLKLPVVLVFNYFAHKSFTFKSKSRRNSQAIKYILANMATWIIANALLIILVGIVGNEELAKIPQSILVPAITYFLFKLFVFREDIV